MPPCMPNQYHLVLHCPKALCNYGIGSIIGSHHHVHIIGYGGWAKWVGGRGWVGGGGSVHNCKTPCNKAFAGV